MTVGLATATTTALPWVIGSSIEESCRAGWETSRRKSKKGLNFGLWFEPEMISVDSELYRAHPDWCLHVIGRSRSEGRNQFVLDFRARRFGRMSISR